MMKTHFLLIIVLEIVPLNTIVNPETKNREGRMSAEINQNCDFSNINLSIPSGKIPCSPIVTENQIIEGLTGIFINTPHKIQLRDSNEIKVCLLSILEAQDASKFGGKELLVLKNETTNKVYNGKFIDDDRVAPQPEAESGADEDDLDMVQEVYFNFNLNTYMRFDRKPGLYHFYITMGPYSSNIVTFVIVEDK